jgi:hypothetical protein
MAVLAHLYDLLSEHVDESPDFIPADIQQVCAALQMLSREWRLPQYKPSQRLWAKLGMERYE